MPKSWAPSVTWSSSRPPPGGRWRTATRATWTASTTASYRGPGGLTTGIVHDLVLQTIGGLFLDGVSPDIPGAVEFGVAQAMVDAIVANGSAPVFNNFATIDYEQFSQELQMVGSTRSMDYALGVYYHEDEAAFRNNRAAVFPIASSETSSHDNATESTAAYGQFTWTPNGASAWSYTLGLRYTLERKEIEYLWRSSAHPFGFLRAVFRWTKSRRDLCRQRTRGRASAHRWGIRTELRPGLQEPDRQARPSVSADRPSEPVRDLCAGLPKRWLQRRLLRLRQRHRGTRSTRRSSTATRLA